MNGNNNCGQANCSSTYLNTGSFKSSFFFFYCRDMWIFIDCVLVWHGWLELKILTWIQSLGQIFKLDDDLENH